MQNKIEYINVFAAFKIISGKKWIHATYSGRIASAFHLDSVLKKNAGKFVHLCSLLLAQKKSHKNVRHASVPIAHWLSRDPVEGFAILIFKIWTEHGRFQQWFWSGGFPVMSASIFQIAKQDRIHQCFCSLQNNFRKKNGFMQHIQAGLLQRFILIQFSKKKTRANLSILVLCCWGAKEKPWKCKSCFGTDSTLVLCTTPKFSGFGQTREAFSDCFWLKDFFLGYQSNFPAGGHLQLPNKFRRFQPTRFETTQEVKKTIHIQNLKDVNHLSGVCCSAKSKPASS